MKKHILIYFLVIVAFNAVYSEQSRNEFSIDKITDLSSLEWIFKADDNPQYKDSNILTNDWVHLSPRNPWQMNAPEYKEYHGIAWYRFNISINSKAEKTKSGVLLSHSYGSYQFYLNGKLIYESDSTFNINYELKKTSKPVLIELPSEYLNVGENVIALRVASMDGWGGFSSDIYSGPINLLRIKWIRDVIRQNGIAFTCLFFAIFYLIHYLMRRNEKYYLWFAGLILSMGSFIFGYFGFSLYVFDYYWSYVLFTFFGGMPIYLMTLKFLHSFLHRKIGKVGLGILSFYLLLYSLLLVEFLFTGSIFYFKKYLYQIMLLQYIITIIYLIVINIRAIREKTPYSILIFIGVSIQFATFLYSTLAYSNVLKVDPLTSEGYLAVIIAFAVILAKRSANTQVELEVAHKNLTAMDRLKDEFLANTSHELRTPLNGIIGLAESLQDSAGKKIGRSEVESLSLITSSGKRLSNLVDDILDFSKLKNKDLEIRKNPVSMKEIVSIVLRISGHLVRGKEITLSNNISDTLPTVLGDENRLQQIMYNLVGNAVKFTESGEVKVTAEESDGFIRISVSDTGIGIPEDKFETIFNSFEQVDASTARIYGGTGIGLAITKQLVELHGGTVTMDSTLGEGSIFTFTVPVSGEKALNIENDIRELTYIHPDFSDIEEPETEETGSGEKEFRILIVDDEPVNLKVYTAQLAGEDYEIRQAQDGMTALKIIEDGFEPDAVLLDIMMPKMTGYQVAEKIREEYPSHKLPILMVTAKNRIDDLVYAFDSGASDYIAKPFTKKELLSRVKTHLMLKKASDRNQELNDSLEEKVKIRTDELNEANLELFEKNTQIMDSINYASSIQQSILPREEAMQKSLKEYFTLWKPRDVVGGDFHWFSETDKGYLFGVCDCTGHGIPGAFMTMTAYSVLNRITSLFIDDNPAKILAEMNIVLRRLLNQDKEDSNSDDGLDMGLCYYNKENGKVIFSGARIALRTIEDGEVRVIKGDKQSIGYFKSSEDYEFVTHEIIPEADQPFYMTTDGFFDQNGGEKDFGFGMTRFNKMILKHCDRPLPEQRDLFDKELKDYMGRESQRDDIAVIGFKV